LDAQESKMCASFDRLGGTRGEGWRDIEKFKMRRLVEPKKAY